MGFYKKCVIFNLNPDGISSLKIQANVYKKSVVDDKKVTQTIIYTHKEI